MVLHSHPKIYDSIGDGYRSLRIPDERIAQQIMSALGDAETICNVGAGTGSYEPLNRFVVAVEPSETMIAQRKNDNRVVRASAEKMPFKDLEFDASMAVLTVHHWNDPVAGLREMKRISSKQVIYTFDPEQLTTLWLTDYIPEIIEFELERAIPIQSILNVMPNASIESVTIPWDCTDGFQGVYWRRPKEYLSHHVRSAISTLAQLPESIVDRGIKRLAKDFESGTWNEKYGSLLQLDSIDFGYRLIVSAND